MENLGRKMIIIRTVFAYKINVAIAAILLFANGQTLVSAILQEMEMGAVLAFAMLTLASLAYGLWSLNSHMTKIILYEHGFVMKSLFSETAIYSEEIKNAAFHRVTLKKLKITVFIDDAKTPEINITSTKYTNIKPLVDYLAQFKRNALVRV